MVAAQEKLARLWARYLLWSDHASIDVQTPVPALVVWASGAITREALATMAQQLLGIDAGAATATMEACLHIGGAHRSREGQLEALYCLIRRASTKGAGEVWWRLHLPTEHAPEDLFDLANPQLPEAQLHEKYQKFREKRCRQCLGTYAADLQDWAVTLEHTHGAPATLSAVCRGLRCTAKATPLSMHIIEREHGHTRKDAEAARHLGHALGAPEVSAIHVLRGAKQQHAAALTPRSPPSGGPGLGGPTGCAPRPRTKRRPTYAKCQVQRELHRLVEDDHRGKRSFELRNTNGYAIFRGEYTRQHWAQAREECLPSDISLRGALRNAVWARRVRLAWRDAGPAVRARYGARARALNATHSTLKLQRARQRQRQAPQAAPGSQQSLPWRAGDADFPLSPADLLATDQHRSIIGNCSMIPSNPELAKQIHAAVAALPKTVPCWRQGFCVDAMAFRKGRVIDAHRSLQRVFLEDMGVELCRSGDALIYFRGRPKEPLPATALGARYLEVFAFITSQCLRPQRSTLLFLRAPSRDLLHQACPQGRVHHTKGDALPPELEIVSAGSWPVSASADSWSFRISTGFAYDLVKLTTDYQASWEASLLNYTHNSPNVLAVKSCRQRYHLFGPEFANLPGADPLDCAEWPDLCDDEEALAMDRDFAAAFEHLGCEGGSGEPGEGPAPPPARPPPGVVLPPRPARVVLPRLHPDAIQVRGNAVFLTGAPRPIGRMSAMVHWYPPSASMRCLHPNHKNCSLTADCTDDAIAALRNWVAQAHDFLDAPAHKAAAPDCVREGR